MKIYKLTKNSENLLKNFSELQELKNGMTNLKTWIESFNNGMTSRRNNEN